MKELIRRKSSKNLAMLYSILVLVSLTVGTASAGVYYVTTDHVGTPQVITDTSQNVVWSGTQHPFGQVDVTTPYIENNVRFPGQYYDKETGLHYNYFRDYDPSLGRYLQSDPIGLNGGLNTYGYALGNPIKFTDPYGLDVLVGSIVVDVGGGVSGTGAINYANDLEGGSQWSTTKGHGPMIGTAYSINLQMGYFAHPNFELGDYLGEFNEYQFWLPISSFLDLSFTFYEAPKYEDLDWYSRLWMLQGVAVSLDCGGGTPIGGSFATTNTTPL